MDKEIIFDEAFLQQLDRLDMAVSMKSQEGMQGGRKSLFKGASLEFSDFREYSTGDDLRRIDWAAYGRLDKLYIKEFLEEKEVVFHLFLDQTRSMAYGTPSKGKTALQIIAALSYLICGHQDRVRICGLQENSIAGSITAAPGRAGFYQLLKKLEMTEFKGQEDLGKRLMQQALTGKGVSVILSDFLMPQGMETFEKALAYLTYKKQKVILVQILSKEERMPEELGDFELTDSETRQKVKITLNPRTLKAYKKRLKAYENQLGSLARKYGMTFVMTEAEKSVHEIILKDFYRKKILF